MADAPNELEVLEARREILQLEIALAQERRAAAEAEQKGKKAADEGGEPTLDFVVPAIYPDARHAESLPTTGILRRGKPTLLSLPSNPVLQHLEAESVKQGHASSHNAWIFRSIENWLPVALRAVGAAAPPNGHYAPKSFRSGFASAVTAMNVSPDRRNYIAGWAANSHAVGTHYVDNSVVVDDAARFLFGHLIGLPPPPVEVLSRFVAPWSSPLANLASRLVTLVSPLRGDT
ncbi:hypothetical protein RI054_41g147960 [Pseudoscourfieldia marina]